MNIADMTIDISQVLHPDSQERLEDELRELVGVSVASFNSRIQNWFSLLYAPESITWLIICCINRLKSPSEAEVYSRKKKASRSERLRIVSC